MEREDWESLGVDEMIIIKLITKKVCVGGRAECGSGLG
jgi:hypothetical protein